MKALAKILAYLAGVALLGALAAPWLFWGGRWIADHTGIAILRETDFQRYFHRSFLLAALALLWPLIRWLRIRSVTELGLAPNPHRARDVAVGVALPILFLWLYGLALIRADLYWFKEHLPWDRLPSLLLTALTVALLEEALFRGAILGAVARSAPAPLAVVSVSALFSILHFLKPREGTIPDDAVTPLSGLALVPEAFHRFADPASLIAGFTTLFAVGLLLAIAARATRSLWLPIGLHAGLILGSRSFSILAEIPDHQRDLSHMPWVGDSIREGLFPLLTLILLTAAVCAYVRRIHTRKEVPPRDR